MSDNRERLFLYWLKGYAPELVDEMLLDEEDDTTTLSPQELRDAYESGFNGGWNAAYEAVREAFMGKGR